MTTLFRRLLHVLRWSRHQADLRTEIETHRALRQDALERAGLAPQDAAHASRRALGNVALAVDDARDVWAIRTIDSLWQDVRAALRGLRKSPGFALVTIATLALGIGANTALFSIFSSLILRPLPVRDPASLALLTNGAWSYPVWEEIRARETALFAGAYAWSPQTFDLSAGGQSDLVDGAYVSGRVFDVLGVTAIRGRMITSADDGGAAPDGPVAVISHRLWRQRFAGAGDVVGRQLTVQRVPFTIIGVLPPGFFGPDVGRMMDVMLPFGTEPLIRGPESSLALEGDWWLQIMVRLKPGQGLDQANAALRSVQPQVLESVTRSNPSRSKEPLTLAAAATGYSPLRGRFETPLSVLVVAVGLVLLVACANIASLLLARALARRRELSVRLALGSSRWRIAQMLFIESLIVAVAGAAFGLVFAKWSSALLVQQLSTWESTVSLDLGLDWRVLGFTAALACVAAIAAGVAPVVGLRSVTPGGSLKDAGRGIAGDRRFAIRSALVVAQIAVSLVLVVAAGLFLRTFASLNRLPLGFEPAPLLVAELNLQASGGPPKERQARVERLREAAAAVPGVRSAAVASHRLLTGGGWSSGMVGIGDGPVSRGRSLWVNATTPGWFETMGMSLRSGRDFDAADRAGSHTAAIVNEAFVRLFLPGQQALGQRVRLGRGDTTYEIVGVVGDAVYATPRDGMMATMYMPMAQEVPKRFWPRVFLTINAAPGQRAAVERDVRAALTQVDPTVAFTVGTFDQLVEATITQERLIAMLSAFFGGLALLLAAVGLYGIVAHAVRARQMEIGLRMALGAAPSSIVRLVFQRVGLLIAAGLALGLAGSLWASRFVESLLFRLEARDPMTFASAAAVLVAVGVLAAWLPARRAARLDPVAVLREG